VRKEPVGVQEGLGGRVMAYGAFDLAGKVVTITGGNSGIGLGMANALAQAGAAVCIWGTNAEKNSAALRQLRGHGVDALALRCDVGDEHAVEDAFAETVRHFGRVDACFANAGVIGNQDLKSFVEMSTGEWRRVMRVNLDGVFYTLRAAARHMVSSGHGGSLVVTSSLAAISGTPRGQHYAATKAGVIAMTQSLAVELARHGIRANAVLPGWIDTEMTGQALHGDRFVSKVLPRVPLRRWGAPGDFGGVAVYLASDASAYHTGDILLIDGGYSKF
jgi:NAD(P)-dependent dehydrogenase (short-subunit alcohol dehydrogenase family)